MDNARIHQGEEGRGALTDAGVYVWFLPPYTPQLNPIEAFFHECKAAYRADPGGTTSEIKTKVGAVLTARAYPNHSLVQYYSDVRENAKQLREEADEALGPHLSAAAKVGVKRQRSM